jgi:hypothetical protein
MLGVTILELLETMMERLVADCGAGLARLVALTVQLVVMVGVLRTRLAYTQRDTRQTHTRDAQKLSTLHRIPPLFVRILTPVKSLIANSKESGAKRIESCRVFGKQNNGLAGQ